MKKIICAANERNESLLSFPSEQANTELKLFILSIIIITGFLFVAGFVFAQESQTAREEAEGKAVWEKFQAKELVCKDLSDEDFEVLGEYFMGQMTGTSHEAMNTTMEQMTGKEGEEQMHVVMAKRLSGCDTSVAFPSQGIGFMPMMNMMMGGGMMGRWSFPFSFNQSNNPMMNFGFTSFSAFGWIFMILWWVLIIVGAVALIKWLMNQGQSNDREKSALNILKERYAKGEIDKKEFEEKKEDLT